MEKEIILCDTSVIIEYYNGNESVISRLDKIEFRNLAINSVTYGEALYGSLNKSDFNKWCDFLDNFILLDINEKTSRQALALLRKYILSHKLHVADSLIAATALYYDIPLFTFNRKDFRYITGLELLDT